ncbi:MAG: protein-glutamate O-methyltransferase CheR [Gammaproteobacteria bacterium]|nr:protein-glutamate O-methyltransferase CheR [Gammaproteobacteria bacterium]
MLNKEISSHDYAAFQSFLADASGIVLGSGKQYLVTSRLGKLMAEYSIDNVGDLTKRLKCGTDRRFNERVIDAMTTNETNWFRDVYPFETLKNKVLPEISKRNRGKIRIWCAASSSGQEPYSISILVQEMMIANPGLLAKQIEIVGTDISNTMLSEARAGIYDEMALSRGLTAERRKRYFNKVADGWQVIPEVRNRVTYKELNILGSFASLGMFDIIFCRNLLIYFSTESKVDILTRMTKNLSPWGCLFLGASESVPPKTACLTMERCTKGMLYRTEQYQEAISAEKLKGYTA